MFQSEEQQKLHKNHLVQSKSDFIIDWPGEQWIILHSNETKYGEWKI